MSKYWSELTKKIEPYTPGEQPKGMKYVKLNTNESPYPPSPRVLEAIKKAADDTLRLYPDPTCDELRITIAEYNNIKKEQVFVGNGSDEVLAFSFMAFFNPEKPILYSDITYSFYPVYSQLFNINYNLMYLDDNFSIRKEDYFIENGGVIISNPNAPTAKYLTINDIKEILEANSESVVIIDEAYIDFGGESAVKLINKYPNLIVIQTLSKSRCLAGLRVGFAMGNKDLIEGLDRIKNSINSYTLDRLALAGAVEAFKDVTYFNEITSRVITTRERASAKFKELGFTVLDSLANFIFVSHAEFPAKTLFQELKSKGILVRYFNKPRIDNYLRVSIGTDDEMDLVLKVIEEIIKG